MGANVWQRDTSGTGPGTSFKIGPTPVQHPARPGKRKLVWTKDQQDQPATPAAFTPSLAQSCGTDAPATSYSQHDHFEKRARMNDGLAASHNGHQQGYEGQNYARLHVPRMPIAETRRQQSGAASQDPAVVQQQRQKAAELAELKRRIQEHEAQLAAQKVTYPACKLCCNPCPVTFTSPVMPDSMSLLHALHSSQSASTRPHSHSLPLL